MDTNNSLDNFFNINIDREARQYLKTACTWARLIAILGFTGAGLSLIQTVIALSKFGFSAASGVLMLTLVIVIGSVIINMILIRFANRMSSSLSNMNQVEFDEGVNSLRSFFKVVGILMIVSLSLCIIALIIYVMFFLSMM